MTPYPPTPGRARSTRTAGWPTGTLPDDGPLTLQALAGQWSAWAEGAGAVGEDAAAARHFEQLPGSPLALAYSRLLAGDVDGAGRTLAEHPAATGSPAGRLVDAAVRAARGSTVSYDAVRAAADDPTFLPREALRLLAWVADLRGAVATADAAWWRLVHDAGADDLHAALRFAVASVAMRHPEASADAVRTVVLDAAVALSRTGRSAAVRGAAVRQVVAELRRRGDPQGAHLVLAAHLAVSEPDAALLAELRGLERAGPGRVVGFVLLAVVSLLLAPLFPPVILLVFAAAGGGTYPGLGTKESTVRRALRPRRAGRRETAASDDPRRCRCWHTATLTDDAATRYLADHLVPSATTGCSAALADALGAGTVAARCPDTGARWLVGPLGLGGAALALRGQLVRPAVPEDDTLRTGFYL